MSIQKPSATQGQEVRVDSASTLLMSLPHDRLDDRYEGLRRYLRWIWKCRYSPERLAQLEGVLIKVEQKFQQDSHEPRFLKHRKKATLSQWIWYRALEESQGASSWIALDIYRRRFLARFESKSVGNVKTHAEIRKAVERVMVRKLLQTCRR